MMKVNEIKPVWPLSLSNVIDHSKHQHIKVIHAKSLIDVLNLATVQQNYLSEQQHIF